MEKLECKKCGNTEKFKRRMALYASYWAECNNERELAFVSEMPSDINDYEFWADEPLNDFDCVVCGNQWHYLV